MIIDKEFKELIPALSSEEYQQLEQNIVSEGCRDSLVLWNETLIDGHNRYEICTKHNLSFNTIQKEFDSRESVIEWIIRNQFGRRNLPAYARSVLALKLEDVIKERAKENQKLSEGKGCQKSDKVNPIDTKKELATLAGVSHDTIAKVKTIEKEGSDEQKQSLMKGETKINTVYQEIKKKKSNVTPAFKTCTICGGVGRADNFLKTHNRCLECHAQVSSGGVSIAELKEVIRKQKEIPLGDEESFNSILPELTEILNTFHIKINRFVSMRDVYYGRKHKDLVELVKKCTEDINSIKKLMEV